MPHFATDRVVVGLQWTGAAFLGLGALLVVVAIGWTTTPEALLRGATIAGLAFGLPGVAAFALALWLDAQGGQFPKIRDSNRPIVRDEAARHPFREPITGYGIAVACALGAWGLRVALDAVLPGNVPFITFFLAVAIAGWLGGFGPALLATFLGVCIARYFYMAPIHSFRLVDLADAVGLGLFVCVCVVIAMLTATLHSALRRIQVLADRLDALTATKGNAGMSTATARDSGSDDSV